LGEGHRSLSSSLTHADITAEKYFIISQDININKIGYGQFSTLNNIQATLIIRNLTLRVFAITRFRKKKKPWENCTVILQSPCTVVAWLCGARTSWSHFTSISVRGSVELASPVDLERISFIFKAMGKRSRPNCDKNGCKCKKQRKAATLEETLPVIHFTRFRVMRWFLGTN
jgi:hypothetical protein